LNAFQSIKFKFVYLNLENNPIVTSEEFLKLMECKRINEIYFDYDKLEVVNLDDKQKIISFLKKSINYVDQRLCARGFVFPGEIRKNLDIQISIFNILINLIGLDIDEQREFFRDKIDPLIKKRIKWANNKKEISKHLGLRYVLLAGLETINVDKIQLLRQAIIEFDSAQEKSWAFFL